MRVGVSGLVRPNSGIGVVQRQVHPRLAELAALVSSPTRDPGGRVASLRGIIAGLTPPGRSLDGYFCSVSPLPLGLRRAAPVVSIVHDLRWQRTAGPVKRVYRSMDLRRVVRTSDLVVCISQRTRDDLVAAIPEAASKAQVSWLGPGIVADDAWSEGTTGQALLIGPAPHKRNELAADVLAAVGDDVVSSVVAVNVSERTRQTLLSAFGEDACTFFGRVSDSELRELYRSAQFYVHLGTDEGFGLPYVEALVSGCEVVAIDQQLTREVLDDAAILVEDGPAAAMAQQWKAVGSPDSARRHVVAERYSWDRFAQTVAQGLGLAPAATP